MNSPDLPRPTLKRSVYPQLLHFRRWSNDSQDHRVFFMVPFLHRLQRCLVLICSASLRAAWRGALPPCPFVRSFPTWLAWPVCPPARRASGGARPLPPCGRAAYAHPHSVGNVAVWGPARERSEPQSVHRTVMMAVRLPPSFSASARASRRRPSRRAIVCSVSSYQELDLALRLAHQVLIAGLVEAVPYAVESLMQVAAHPIDLFGNVGLAGLGCGRGAAHWSHTGLAG